MKVLFIEPCFKNFGGYFRSINICKSLSKNNIKVTLLLSSDKKFQLSIKKTIINKNLIQYELPRLWVNFYINGRILRGIIATFFGLFQSYDVIHAAVPTQLESNIPAILLKLFGKKIVIDWDDLWDSNSITDKYLKKYIRFCEKQFPKYIKNYVVTSDYLGKLAKQRGAKKIIKIINGVDINQFKLFPKKNNLNFLTFGNTYSSDRGKLLIKLFEKILKLEPKATLTWNLNLKELNQQQSLEISKHALDQIICVGNIQQKDLGKYISSSQAILFMMGNLDSERACFPIRIGSYLNGEAIIVLNDTNTEVVNTLKPFDCAIIDKNLDILAKKTVKLLNNPKLRQKFKLKIKYAKKQLSWDNLISPLISFYKTL